MPRYLDKLGLSGSERRALLMRMLDVVTEDNIVTTVLCHAKWIMDELVREQQRPYAMVEHAEHRIADAVTSLRAVRPALQARARIELAEQRRVIADEAEIRRRHAENPKCWPSFEETATAADRRVGFAQRDLAWCDAVLAEHGADEDLAAAAAERPEAP